MALLRNTFYNLMGLGLPLIAAVFSIPYLVHALGQSRFGILTLVWAVVSYFGLFDLGLGRALTQKLAGELASKDHSRVRPLAVTSLVLLTALGLLAGVCMALMAEWGIHMIKAVPDHDEVLRTVYWMAAAMPFIVITSGLRGILEAAQSFAIINLIRLPMGLFTFLGPVLAVWHGYPQLDVIACILAAGRIIACLVHAWYAMAVLPSGKGSARFDATLIKPLCASGGWMSVTNIVGPMMGYLDRFVVGALASAQAVALYATPQELISKLSILPSALMSILFPQFAVINSDDHHQRIQAVSRAADLTTTLCIPAFAFFSLFSHQILGLWIGPSFADDASHILSLMACGMLINSIAFIPLTWLQARNHSRAVAMIHTLELPLFFLSLWCGITLWGLIGAALAWALRIVLDAIFLWSVLGKTESALKEVSRKELLKSLGAAAIIYASSTPVIPLTIRIAVFILAAAYFGHRLYKMTRHGWN